MLMLTYNTSAWRVCMFS